MLRVLAATALVTATLPVTSALAQDTTSSNLNVTTRVNATCSSPGSADLEIPFPNGETSWSDVLFNGGDTYVSDPATISVSCSGAVAPDKVVFGMGQNDTEMDASSDYRVMKNGSACIQYALYADDDGNPISSGDLINAAASQELSLSGSSFDVRAGFITGSDNCSTTITDPVDMPAGDYTDSVTMTIHFSAVSG